VFLAHCRLRTHLGRTCESFDHRHCPAVTQNVSQGRNLVLANRVVQHCLFDSGTVAWSETFSIKTDDRSDGCVCECWRAVSVVVLVHQSKSGANRTNVTSVTDKCLRRTVFLVVSWSCASWLPSQTVSVTGARCRYQAVMVQKSFLGEVFSKTVATELMPLRKPIGICTRVVSVRRLGCRLVRRPDRQRATIRG
jgi:hypothetical protein